MLLLDDDTMTAEQPSASARASELLALWHSVAGRHVSLGTACACGTGGVTLQLNDFEQDIVDYLLAQTERHRRADIGAWLQANARNPLSRRWRVQALLDALIEASTEGASTTLPPDGADFLLDRLGRTLRSFAAQHT